MVTDVTVRVERVGRAAQAKIVQASIPKALRRFIRFTVAPNFEIRIGTSSTHAPSSLQDIRLSSDLANSLSRSRNSWADGDGCVGWHLIQVQ